MQTGMQRSFSAHGVKGECGCVRFEAGSRTIKVPVMAKTIFMGFGQTKTGDCLNSLVCTCDNSVVDGKTTFTRHGGYYGDDPEMNFLILGW